MVLKELVNKGVHIFIEGVMEGGGPLILPKCAKQISITPSFIEVQVCLLS